MVSGKQLLLNLHHVNTILYNCARRMELCLAQAPKARFGFPRGGHITNNIKCVKTAK